MNHHHGSKGCIRSPAQLLQLFMLLAWVDPSVDAQLENDGLCKLGMCINCIHCKGNCARCECFSSINACCCESPVGSYARGYSKIPCPGGTYQDDAGQGFCKPCNTTVGAVYDINKRGSKNQEDCEDALCHCDIVTELCDHCYAPQTIIDSMSERPINPAVCNILDIPIPVYACTWIMPSSSRRAFARSAGGLAILTILRMQYL